MEVDFMGNIWSNILWLVIGLIAGGLIGFLASRW